MSTELVWLALLMGLVTYPSRALPMLIPGIDRLPARALDYLRLVGPAVLATLAAVAIAVAVDDQRATSFHIGIDWLAVAACVVLMAARRGLLVATVAAALVAAVARAGGLA
jgi:branched-subunit amino acid transport protein